MVQRQVGFLAEWRTGTMRLSCPAPVAGAPAVTVPMAKVDGLPVGMSCMGIRGSDRSLLDLAEQISPDAGGAP